MLRLVTKIKSKQFYQNLILKRYDSISKEIARKMYEKNLGPIKSKLFPEAKYGGENLVTLITGNELGRQCAEYVKRIFHQVHAPIMFEEVCVQDCDKKNAKNGERYDEGVLSIQRNRYGLYCDILDDKNRVAIAVHELDLFVCITQMFPFHGFKDKCNNQDVAITILSENMMGDNAKLEYEPVKGLVETLSICTMKAVTRFINFAFNYAKEHNHQIITFVHKESEFPLSDGLFMTAAEKIHRMFPDIVIEDMLVNDAAINLVMEPKRFNLICTPGRYGNCLSTICSGVCGGAGLFCTSNISENLAIFQPLENRLGITISESEGLSPYGVISAACQLLKYIGHCNCGDVIWEALLNTMLVDNLKTKQFGGNYSADEVVNRILEHIDKERCDV